MQKDTKLKPFQFSHFIIPVYKKPGPAILNIYVPVILLGIINCSIFYQDNRETGKKMLNMGAVMLAFVEILPIVR